MHGAAFSASRRGGAEEKSLGMGVGAGRASLLSTFVNVLKHVKQKLCRFI